MNSLTNDISPLALEVFTDLLREKEPTVKTGSDLEGRSIHSLLMKTAAIPRAAMPWMKALSKSKPKGRMITMAPKGSPVPKKPPKTPKGHFATPGGAPPISPESIKATSSMTPGGKLMRTKFK